MAEGALASLWNYDFDPPKKAKSTSSSCAGCIRKRAKLDKEQAANVALIQSIAGLARARAEDLLELEALRSRLRSLEHGGGVPQPAPPDPDACGSGGGVAARPSAPSPSPPFPSSSSALTSAGGGPRGCAGDEGGLSWMPSAGKQTSGPAAAVSRPGEDASH
ncbi:unnamed protein product, partial [Scytosiphon promiscuus]